MAKVLKVPAATAVSTMSFCAGPAAAGMALRTLRISAKLATFKSFLLNFFLLCFVLHACPFAVLTIENNYLRGTTNQRNFVNDVNGAQNSNPLLYWGENEGNRVVNKTIVEGLRPYALGEKLRTLRLRKSMGLVELGKHTGLSAAMLSKLERGKLFPTLPTLLRIALVFGVGLSISSPTSASVM